MGTLQLKVLKLSVLKLRSLQEPLEFEILEPKNIVSEHL